MKVTPISTLWLALGAVVMTGCGQTPPAVASKPIAQPTCPAKTADNLAKTTPLTSQNAYDLKRMAGSPTLGWIYQVTLGVPPSQAHSGGPGTWGYAYIGPDCQAVRLAVSPIQFPTFEGLVNGQFLLSATSIADDPGGVVPLYTIMVDPKTGLVTSDEGTVHMPTEIRPVISLYPEAKASTLTTLTLQGTAARTNLHLTFQLPHPTRLGITLTADAKGEVTVLLTGATYRGPAPPAAGSVTSLSVGETSQGTTLSLMVAPTDQVDVSGVGSSLTISFTSP